MAENEQPTFRESLDTALEVMAEDPYLRILLKRVPLFGDSLVEIAAGKGQQIAQERRDEFLELLAERFVDLEGLALRKDYFETPEGIDMLVKALDESRKTRSRKKREMYARILKGAILDFERREYSSEEYLHLVADLTEKELRVARLIYRDRPEPDEQSWSAWKGKACEELDVDESDIGMALGRIGSLGLIENVNSYLSEGDGVAILDRPVYKIAPAFEKLMRFLGSRP